MNYWRDKSAGESFTHILPYEKLFIDQGKKLIEKDHKETTGLLKAFDEKKTIDVGLILPTTHSPTHIFVDRDFQDDLRYWQQQTIPSYYQTYIQNYSKIENSSIIFSQCESAAFPTQFLQEDMSPSILQKLEDEICSHQNKHFTGLPAFVFHLKESSLNHLAETIYGDYTLHNWVSWKVKDATISDEGREKNDVEIIPTALIVDTIRWKESMPGGWVSPRNLSEVMSTVA